MKELLYPIYGHPLSAFEKLLLKMGHAPIKCNVCGAWSIMEIRDDNFREGCYCSKCKSSNRQRQISYVLCKSADNADSLKGFASENHKAVYNTETQGVFHDFLSPMNGYTCSEYFGPQYGAGEIIDGKMHQDLMNLSFEDESFDCVISSDVMEHVADPYAAHAEIYRVLKKGGRHIFTVPFYQTMILDERRAYMENGNVWYVTEPMYHLDPLREKGILVFNIFSLEMIVKLGYIGFKTNLYHLYKPINGIIGQNGVVFEAIKEHT